MGVTLAGYYDYLQHQQGIGGGVTIIQGGTTKWMKGQAGGSNNNATYQKNTMDLLNSRLAKYGPSIDKAPWASCVKAKTDAAGLNWDDVKAQIALESLGNPNADNGTYEGIFQINRNYGVDGKNPCAAADWYVKNVAKNRNYRKRHGINDNAPAMNVSSSSGSNIANAKTGSSNGNNNEIATPEPPLDTGKLYGGVSEEVAFDENYKSSENYTTNKLDFRLGTSFSNIQHVGNGMEQSQNIKGSPAIFNDYALFRYYGINDSNQLYDTIGGKSYVGNDDWKAPTVANLIEWGENNRQFPYNYSDFLYSKYFGIIPNNQLITLRRYALPTYDHGLVSSAQYNGTETNKNGATVPKYTAGKRTDAFQIPVAQAITYLSDQTENTLDKLMTFTVGMNWNEQTSDVNKIEPNEIGNSDIFGTGTIGNMANFLSILTGKATDNTISGEQAQINKYDPYEGENAPLKYKIYGPVNVIDKTYTRGRGLVFSQEFEIKFHYSLRSIGQINPKMAMLDLISNLLSLTYNNAKFWGGANRFFPNTPQYPFIGSQRMWFDANPGGFINSLFKGAGTALNSIGDFFNAFTKNPQQALQNLLKGGAGTAMAMMVGNSQRPEILSIPSLLTGNPVGEWHLVVGNPMNPIATIGNLIIPEDGMSISFNNTLGADDFPTEMIATIKLKHGRPRDKGDIESMFNLGHGRLYYAYKNQMEPWNRSSATRNSENSTYGQYSLSGDLAGRKTIGPDGIVVGSNSANWSGDSIIRQAKEFGSSAEYAGKNGWYAAKSFVKSDRNDKQAYIRANNSGGGSE